MGEKICVRNGMLFYFNDGGKLDIYYIKINKNLWFKYISALFVACTEFNWKVTFANGLCVSIFLNNMRW